MVLKVSRIFFKGKHLHGKEWGREGSDGNARCPLVKIRGGQSMGGS